MASPKPKHAHLKLIEGSRPGHDSGGRPVKMPPGFLRLPPDPPAWLTPEARAEWDRVVPELQRLQLLTPLNGPVLAAYCETWSRYVDAAQTIQREGQVVTNGRGGPVRHPALVTLEKASTELRQLAAEFGLTPASEARLTTAKGDDEGESNPYAGTAASGG